MHIKFKLLLKSLWLNYHQWISLEMIIIQDEWKIHNHKHLSLFSENIKSIVLQQGCFQSMTKTITISGSWWFYCPSITLDDPTNLAVINTVQIYSQSGQIAVFFHLLTHWLQNELFTSCQRYPRPCYYQNYSLHLFVFLMSIYRLLSHSSDLLILILRLVH